MGMVFQQHAVWPHMSVARNVEYPLLSGGRRQAERHAASRRPWSWCLGGFARRRDSLSGGQRQRRPGARHRRRPTVLLSTKPSPPSTSPSATVCRELVTHSPPRLTTVHVTRPHGALSIADRIVELGEGRIRQVATPQELVSRPATAEVAAFIADATLLDATVLPVAPSEVIGSGGTLTLAVLPSMVSVLPAGSGGIPAQVRSVLYDAGDWSLTLDALGTVFRATVRGGRPEVGDPVTIRVDGPLGYRS